MLISAGVSLNFQETTTPLTVGGIASILIGGIVYFSSKNSSTKRLGIKEGLAIVTASWILSCILGAIPYLVLSLLSPTIELTITDSIFESVSGFTTTGSSILTNIENLPKGILFWRSLTQWMGGMGIVILMIAILPKVGVGGLQAFKMETPGPLKNDRLMPRITQTAKVLYSVYLLLSITLFILLVAAQVSYFDAFIHTFSTIATGGFSNYNNSVAGLNNINAEYIITFFMWFSGVNFSLIYFLLWKKDLKLAIQNTEFKVYSTIYLAAVIFSFVFLYSSSFYDWSISETFRYTIFNVTSILTTTGYSTFNYSLWPQLIIFILIVLMTIGGCTGSTTGSLKVLRHIISFKFIKFELLKVAKPNLVTSIKIGNRALNDQIVQSVIALTLSFFTALIIGTFIITALDINILDAAGISLANLSGVGPAFNNFGPDGSYATLPFIGKWTVICLMLLGRLEIITILGLIIPITWLKR